MTCIKPAPLPATFYVDYVDSTGRRRVFDYDRDTHVFTATAFAAELDVTFMGGNFVIGGELAASVDADGVLVVEQLSEFWAPQPRLEFMREEGGVAELLAALSQDGIFAVSTAVEDDAIPAGTDQFIFFDKISISQAGLVAVEIQEATLA
jgi:hypothetical protein